MEKKQLHRLHEWLWEVPSSYRRDMRVPARLYATEKMLDSILQDRSAEQLINVATLPGVCGWVVAMPDIHEGYGFPIGGVAAIDVKEGVISPGGIGYDINCGVRLLRSHQTATALAPRLPRLVHSLARAIPSGVGRGGPIRLKKHEIDRVLRDGAAAAVEMGHGEGRDLQAIESRGKIDGAEPELVSDRARDRGWDQLGTIGAGNHFVEVDVVADVFDEAEAERLSIEKEQVLILIHTGSRGLGHQVATDSLRVMVSSMPRYGIQVPDRELACAPFRSTEGQNYFHAMAAAANFAWANRQIITAGIRRAWKYELGEDGNLDVVYDVAHNVAKIERYTIGGGELEVVVHRKGATRAFPGQPVLIPGSMGTASYILVGQPGAMEQSFGSSCHGAGRVMSRTRARSEINAAELRERMQKLGIITEAGSNKGLVEEAPEAYKDVDSVVEVVHRAGIARKVARLRPLGVIKG
jgi:tRNA-splicing ligase RtcB (3'-phosphate/5'-hydroxy nucleic acid ligase)